MRAELERRSERPAAPDLAPTGRIEHTAWLTDDLLLAVGWFDKDDGSEIGAGIVGRNDGIHMLALEAPQNWPWPSGWLRLLVAEATGRGIRGDADADGGLGTLQLDRRDGPVLLNLPESSDVASELQTMLREVLAGLNIDCRARVLAFLATATASRPPSLRLSHSLASARAVLRERLPRCPVSLDEPHALHIDMLLGIGPTSYYMEGWLRDEESPVKRLTAVSPEGCRTELTPDLFRYPRPDVAEFYRSVATQADDDHGFIAYFSMEAPSLLSTGWVVEMVTEAGAELEAEAADVQRDPLAARETILADLLHERTPKDRLRRLHVRPALTRLEQQRREAVHIVDIDQHGEPPTDPHVSIIVPLHRRIDFLEHQLAQFAHDPEIADADLIYVLDSPELADAFRHIAAHLTQLYPSPPFRVVTLNRNAGFSGANNLGASLGRGRRLLLLNSDVLPDRPGWLSRMTAFYDRTDAIGALAPKLLYEDDSLQHAGLYFNWLAAEGLWTNEHFYKGLHRSLPAANVARIVPAVTAACMMIDTELYRDLGGLRGIYVQGDYEDTDLCLRLCGRGLHSWYLPDVELYHLEGQSYSETVRRMTSAYNRWLHTAEWGEVIERIMGGFPAQGVPCR